MCSIIVLCLGDECFETSNILLSRVVALFQLIHLESGCRGWIRVSKCYQQILHKGFPGFIHKAVLLVLPHNFSSPGSCSSSLHVRKCKNNLVLVILKISSFTNEVESK